MTFTTKNIEVTFTLLPVKDVAGNTTSQPVFAGSDANQVTLRGLRVSAHIQKAGGASQGEAQLRIFGMSLQLMNQLSTLGRTPVFISSGNQITIAAGEGDATPATIFKGYITQAYTDLGAAPESVFAVSAYSLAFQATQSIPPTSVRGPADVATILQGLATQMGLSFENNGVSVQLPTSYFSGSAKQQAEDVIRAARTVDWIVDNGILAIWPKGASRAQAAPLISAATGMIGYPYPSGQGLLGVKTQFNPNINFGAKVQVDSIIKPACGTWTVCSLEHEIESNVPSGEWATLILGTPPGYLTVQGA